MTRKRTNFKQMDCDTYTSYLDHKPLHYEKFVTTTVLGLSVIKISPKNSRMTPRVFDNETGKQIDPKTELTGIDISSKQLRLQLVKVIDEKIQNMSTKGVYHPRRLLPKWQSLNTVDQKLQLFRKYMKAPTSSIGFIRLIAVNLPNKTLESIVIDYTEYEKIIAIDDIRQKCIDKFKRYKNGKEYLELKGLI